MECALTEPSAAGPLEVFGEISDDSDINRKRIGQWIARHAKQVAGGLRIEAARRTGNAEGWKVISV